ncbi:type II secretion system protein G (GspG) [Dyella jiangningensis]|nr:type II secretion system protein G (GspG) [Dyella sp. AtDHG13]SDK65294.1 type II secretion system protein G (GspG) [Dyella jiangningensis]
MVTDMTRRQEHAFTLIELLVVLAIIAALLTLVVPRYFEQVDKAKETVLRQNLASMRESIDHFHADQRRYPDSLKELVERRYLREIPKDTLTGNATSWKVTPPPDGGTGVYDVHSGAPGKASDGTEYRTWW